MDINFLTYADQAWEEILRQDNKWGPDRIHEMPLWAVILGEEYGEFCQAILNKDTKNTKEELVQIIALCFQILKSMDTSERYAEIPWRSRTRPEQ